jgi:hypothetical protein
LTRRESTALEDYFESEVAIAAAATAAVLSPRVRGVLRTGAVYGLAGVLMAGSAHRGRESERIAGLAARQAGRCGGAA